MVPDPRPSSLGGKCVDGGDLVLGHPVIKREVRLPVYWVLVGGLTSILSPLLALLGSVSIANHNTQEQFKQQAEQAAVLRQEGASRYCDLVRAQVGIYEETPPITPAGTTAQRTWLAEYRRQGCLPSK